MSSVLQRDPARFFVTGATGWIGSAVVPELLGAGHAVVGLARSGASAAALAAAGAEVLRATLDDLDALGETAAASDGVLHLAFKHEQAFSGDFEAAAAADRRAIETFGVALDGTGRPLVIASGLAGHGTGSVATEDDQPDPDSPAGHRVLSERTALALAGCGVRSSSVRLPPTVHGDGDHGFLSALVGVAREKGVSGYIGGARWPAVHRLDAASAFRLVAELAPAGSVLHAVTEEGVPLHDVAAAIGRGLGVPVAEVAREDAAGHFGWLARFLAIDVRATSVLTRERLGWNPQGPALLEDLAQGHYFAQAGG
jgi:nucleoside-diphosphate-sugar epimerase